MLRKLHQDQPESFAFTPDNLAWARAEITKYPEGRQASAVIALLWRAQEQEGWVSRPAIEYIAAMLDMPQIRVLEVATFYFMFHLSPMGSVAHVQVCGTTPCMLCGAEDLVAVCKRRIHKRAHTRSADGKLSWEEVECLGACANAPMAQIGKDYYEDLTAETFERILDELEAGRVPTPGSQSGRFASEPSGGLTSLTEPGKGGPAHNASVGRALELGDTIKRIDGTEVALEAPWLADSPSTAETAAGRKPELLDAPRAGGADDLRKLKGVGPKLEERLNAQGVYHYDQVASWGPAEIAWMDATLDLRGRIERDGWVAQARALAAGAG